MSFKFSRDDKSTAAGVRRIARQEIESALSEIADADMGFDEKVHRVRRRCKKLRGLIRLIRPGFNTYSSVNAAVREAAAGLAHTRDAAVVVETLDSLAKAGNGSVEPGTYERLRARLTERAVHKASSAEEERLLEEFAGRVGALEDSITGWRLEKREFAALEGGLTQVYKRMGKSMLLARVVPSDENFHEWRKMVKYHWHHIGLMREGAPDVLGVSRTMADSLGETLGEHHNLAVLIDILGEGALEDGGRAAQAAARERQKELARRAFDLGLQLTAETPRALARRFERYWALLRK
ncbi:CHAD domain-containing protein [Devosia nitrariae]|nr:CHAD domain-containing protein [Devosia nitrariae]